jgi:hypothetical protein
MFNITTFLSYNITSYFNSKIQRRSFHLLS